MIVRNMMPWPVLIGGCIVFGLIGFILILQGEDRLSDKPRRILIPQGISDNQLALRRDANYLQADVSVLPTMSQPIGNETGSSAASLQTRDPEWAGKTESNIDIALKNTPYLMKSAPIQIVCGANICEVNGKLETNISGYNRDVATKYLNGDGLTDDLGKANAMIDQIVIDQATGKFTIYFSRVRK